MPEKQMHAVRWLILLGWLTIVFSLFYDPLSSYLTEPTTSWSFLRIDPRYLDPELCKTVLLVQGKCVHEQPYPIGPKIFWGMVIPCAIMTLLVLGHETWRRICPLAFLSQIPRSLGRQRQVKIMNPKTGKARFELAKVDPNSWLGRNHLYLQFGLLAAGLCIRILFINSNRVLLGSWFVLTIVAAITVGYLFAGKTWCQYFCPMAPVQTVFNGPRSLLGSEAHQGPKQAITQSMCRSVSPEGQEKSACVSCNSPCVDIDSERHYWNAFAKPGRKLVQYGYVGLVAGFYAYFTLYSGTLYYYYSGVWNHEEDQLAQLFTPGFYLLKTSIPIPKLIAVPLTIGAFIGSSYLLFSYLEKAYRGYRHRRQQPVDENQARHVIFSICTFVAFNTYFMFGGRPVLKLILSPTLELGFNGFVMLVSSLWLYRTLGRSAETYSRESLASSLRRQLSKLPIDFSKYLKDRSIDELKPDEVHVLAQVLPNFNQEYRFQVYKGLLRDQLEQGNVASINSLEALKSVRLELNITEEEHYDALNALSIDSPDLLDGTKLRSRENQLRLESYRQALELQLLGLLDLGVSLPEALKSRNQQIQSLRQEYGISTEEEQQLISQIIDESTAIQKQAESLLSQLKNLAVQRQVLSHLVCRPEASVYELLRSIAIDHKLVLITKKLLNIVEILDNPSEETKIATQIKLLAEPIVTTVLEATEGSLSWSQRLSPAVRSILFAIEPNIDELSCQIDPINLPLQPRQGFDRFVSDETPTQLRRAGDPIVMAESLNLQIQVIDVLKDLLQSVEPIVRAAALYALEQLDPQQGHEQAKRLLAETISENWLVLETAQSIMGERQIQTMVPTLIVQILKEGRSEQRIFQQSVIRLGRSQLNEIVLDHPRVSKQHAVFTLDERGVNVIDLDSPGELYIIGRRVVENERFRLSQGDIIRFSKSPEPTVIVNWEQRPMRSRTPSTSLGSLEKLLLIFENSFLRSVKPDALLELARRSKIQMYNRGDVVYQMGEISNELHLVVSGAVDVIVSQGGQDIVINTIHCGQTIGEMGVLSRQPRSATVVGSAEHNKLLVIEAEVFDAVLRGDSEISRSLLLDMIERLRRTNVHVHA
jgi:hypothetical protein